MKKFAGFLVPQWSILKRVEIARNHDTDEQHGFPMPLCDIAIYKNHNVGIGGLVELMTFWTLGVDIVDLCYL